MGDKSISQVLQELIDTEGCSVNALAIQTGIPKAALYSILRRKDAKGTNIDILKALADFFNEDLEIFCGEPDYARKPRLTQAEVELLIDYRKLSQEARAIIQRLTKSPPKPMSDIQEQILQKSYRLNDKGQTRLLETCEDIVAGGRYTK